eukprot:518115-Amphidinium_carterae.1
MMMMMMMTTTGTNRSTVTPNAWHLLGLWSRRIKDSKSHKKHNPIKSVGLRSLVRSATNTD